MGADRQKVSRRWPAGDRAGSTVDWATAPVAASPAADTGASELAGARPALPAGSTPAGAVRVPRVSGRSCRRHPPHTAPGHQPLGGSRPGPEGAGGGTWRAGGRSTARRPADRRGGRPHAQRRPGPCDPTAACRSATEAAGRLRAQGGHGLRQDPGLHRSSARAGRPAGPGGNPARARDLTHPANAKPLPRGLRRRRRAPTLRAERRGTLRRLAGAAPRHEADRRRRTLGCLRARPRSRRHRDRRRA